MRLVDCLPTSFRQTGHTGLPISRARQLDGLRAIAVTFVLCHHWTEWGTRINLGGIGVQVFFALSGFLITRILLDQRVKIESGRGIRKLELGRFYLSRALRILPIYYLILLLIFITGRFEDRGAIPWHALYGSNILFFERGEFSGGLAHFWTLAVEQQVYLFWPLIVLFAPNKWILRTILLGILFAPISRGILYAIGYTNFAQYNTLLCSNLDSLGMGALLAWAHVVAAERARQGVYSGLLLALPISLVAFTVALGWGIVSGWGTSIVQILFFQTSLAVLSGWLVLRAQSGFAGAPGNLLSSRLLAYVGMISYGVYLFHVFVPVIRAIVLRAIHAPEGFNQGALGFLLALILTFAVASFSWFFIEQPINSLRKMPNIANGALSQQASY